MEKLIELLNEWERERVNHNTKEYMKRGKNSFTRLGIIEVISKSYGFIKWLVENDKIDRDNQALQYAKSDLSKFFAEWKDKNGMSDDYAMLLMLLSIQDEPIRFLCEILA